MKKTISLVLVLALGLITSVAKADFTFGTPKNLGPTVNSSHHDLSAYMSCDGLSLYFASDRPGGSGDFDLWVTTRASTANEWSAPVNLSPTVNSSAKEWFPSISADGLALYFCRGEAGAGDIWVTTRSAVGQPWGSASKLGPAVNTSADDWLPRISGDGLRLYYVSNRTAGLGGYDIWLCSVEKLTRHA